MVGYGTHTLQVRYQVPVPYEEVEQSFVSHYDLIQLVLVVYFIRAGKFPESFKLGKIRSFIDKSLNKMKKKENFWSF